MGAFLKHLAVALVIAGITYGLMRHFAPGLSMRTAVNAVSADGAAYNQWRALPRVEPGAPHLRDRASPDFAVYACAFDLKDGPVLISAAPWDDYWTVALHDDQGRQFFSLNDRETPRGADIVLARAGRRAPNVLQQIVVSPSRRGVAVLRRLAPSGAAYDRAHATSRADICATLNEASG